MRAATSARRSAHPLSTAGPPRSAPSLEDGVSPEEAVEAATPCARRAARPPRRAARATSRFGAEWIAHAAAAKITEGDGRDPAGTEIAFLRHRRLGALGGEPAPLAPDADAASERPPRPASVASCAASETIASTFAEADDVAFVEVQATGSRAVSFTQVAASDAAVTTGGEAPRRRSSREGPRRRRCSRTIRTSASRLRPMLIAPRGRAREAVPDESTQRRTKAHARRLERPARARDGREPLTEAPRGEDASGPRTRSWRHCRPVSAFAATRTSTPRARPHAGRRSLTGVFAATPPDTERTVERARFVDVSLEPVEELRDDRLLDVRHQVAELPRRASCGEGRAGPRGSPKPAPRRSSRAAARTAVLSPEKLKSSEPP